ncbi:MAG TPA: alanine--tRNA ligase [Candidatus Methylacidiphilales bacterium]
MTSAQLRESFLEFFREKEHTIVASSSLLPDSPNLLFTNAGMNQFVPIFLGKANAPYNPPRAADTQKCIRAGGKHNDLEDVGLDTYHHTFFEMLGNWSFGEYFKAEAIAWAWELLVGRWKIPANRLYATVYKPQPGDPAEFDQESYDLWAKIFSQHGLDPQVHIVYGNKKDNFWMMGETGPCGPCSEVHVDLTPAGNTSGSLVNKGDARCIEVWNLVFIQYNANADGTFVPLPAKHVDTGMGFERIASVIQCTEGFRKFDPKKISNYETDVFRPYFAAIEKMSGKRYGSTLPPQGSTGDTEEERIDVAFRVIADHLRTLTFAIGDGIAPSNEGRGYVLRRILRRAVRYGRVLGFNKPFLHELVPVVAKTMGSVFSNVDREQEAIARTIRAEEESFSRTLDRGLLLFEEIVAASSETKTISGADAFKLYDTYGFPLDLTQLMARERGLGLDEAGFNALMEEQRARSQAAQKKEVISVEVGGLDLPPTDFLGYDTLEAVGKVLHVDGQAVVVDRSPFYAEMGGQVGDTGDLFLGDRPLPVENTTKIGEGIFLHRMVNPPAQSGLAPGADVGLRVDAVRRYRISAHHSATHLLHWALRKVLGEGVAQKGSLVTPDRFRFDFSHAQPVSDDQLMEIQRLIVERVEADDAIFTEERPYAEVKGDASILQLFGDKYGETVRVVSIGDYSKELCGGTHVQSTSQIGFVKVIMESGIAAGVRRIEAVAGWALTDHVRAELPKQDEKWRQLQAKKADIAPLQEYVEEEVPRANWHQLLARQQQLVILERDVRQWEKEAAANFAARLQSEAAELAKELVARARELNTVPTIIEDCGERHPEFLTHLVDAIKKDWIGVAVLAARSQGRVSLAVSVADDYKAALNAASVLQEIAPIVNGKGGGKPGFARGSGDNPDKIPDALKRAEQLF